MVGAIVGFFTIPVLGIVLGGIGALWLAELVRLRHPRKAWDTTWAALQGYGVGTLVQGVAGVAILACGWSASGPRRRATVGRHTAAGGGACQRRWGTMPADIRPGLRARALGKANLAKEARRCR